MIPVGKTFSLIGQVGAAAINQIDAWQPVFLCDLLGAQVLLDRHRVVGATFHRGIVADDHDLAAFDAADTGDHRRTGGGAVIHAMGSGCADFQKWRAGIE